MLRGQGLPASNGRDGIDLDLHKQLLSMEEEDLRVRAELAAGGALFEGYHPRMEDVHRRNAARLRAVIAAHGWPGESLVGQAGAEAAWRIAQHAIGEPSFQRACLERLRAAAAAGDVPARHAAYLEDRIRMLEGRPQLYGTQLESADDGRPVPYQIQGEERVDERRAAVGLEPLAEQMKRVERGEPADPKMRAERDAAYRKWLRRAGWR
jgi:hypothetical protein